MSDTGAVGFGESMMPFFRPQDEIHFSPTAPSAVRVGDVVTFRTPRNTLVTHRVVKVVRNNGTLSFLTKGDNRLEWDSWLKAGDIVGKVTKVGHWNLTRPWWGWVGRLVAFFSYAQGFLYRRLANSWPNQMRHRLERKGLFPRLRCAPLYRISSNPFLALFFICAQRSGVYRRS